MESTVGEMQVITGLPVMEDVTQGAHAGLIMSYFRFCIYKAIRKVLFVPYSC